MLFWRVSQGIPVLVAWLFWALSSQVLKTWYFNRDYFAVSSSNFHSCFFFSLFSSPSGSLVKTRQCQLFKTVMVFYFFVCFIRKNDKYMLCLSVSCCYYFWSGLFSQLTTCCIVNVLCSLFHRLSNWLSDCKLNMLPAESTLSLVSLAILFFVFELRFKVAQFVANYIPG